MRNLSRTTKRIRLPLDTTTTYVGAAGTTALLSEGIDCRGFEGCLLRVAFGAIVSGGVQSIKAQASDDDGATDGYSDLAGTAVTVADTDDNKVFELDIWRPQKRWLAIAIPRATQNATIDYMEAILYGASHASVTQTAIIGSTEVHVSPAEGTA